MNAPEFDRDVFATHTLPLAAYAEPEGYARLAKMTRPQACHYEKHVPACRGAASALYDTIEQIGEWGRQYVTPEADGSYGADWRTENAAHLYRARRGVMRHGTFLRARDLLRALTRADVYAVGRTDRHVDDLERGQYGDREWRTTRVSVLCLDVDMDEAWEKRDIAAIRRELAIESQIAAALDLPCRCFRTGRRGHQAVLPFPAPVDRSAAAWLLDAYLSLLVPFHIQSRGAAEADAHNLHGIVRVAGGRHAGTERIALWMDPTTATLMPIEQQMEMMHMGYVHPARRTPVARAFADAMEQIAYYLLHRRGIPRHLYAPPSVRDAAFWNVVKDLPDNLLVERFRSAQETWAVEDEECLVDANEVDFSEDESKRIWATVEGAARVSQAHGYVKPEPSADEGTRAWAERIWAIDWPAASMFWEWVSEGGARGITATKVLFGEDSDAALNAMLARVDAHPIATLDPAKARERRRVIRALWRTHEMFPFRNRDSLGGEAFADARALAERELPEVAARLIPEIIAHLNAVKPIQARCLADVEHIIEIVLLAFAHHSPEPVDADDEWRGDVATRYGVALSLNDIVAAIRKRWPDATAIDRSTVNRHLNRLRAGTPRCGYALVEEMSQAKFGALPVTRYLLGADLRATPFGESLITKLPDFKASASTPREGAEIRTRFGTFAQRWTAKRGRKHKKTTDKASVVRK